MSGDFIQITISAALSEARLVATAEFFDTGSGQARLQLFDDTTGRVLLAEILLPKPCGTIAAGVLTLTPSGEVLVLTTGKVTSADLMNGAGVLGAANLPVAATDDTSIAAPIRLPDTQLYAGGYTRLASGALA
jgi:hypothetical protein